MGWKLVIAGADRGRKLNRVTTPKLSRSRTAQRQNSSAWKRFDHNRACLSAPRKLCRRAHHILRELGDNAPATPGAPETPMRATA